MTDDGGDRVDAAALARAVSHDVRAPLRGMTQLVEWVVEDAGAALPEGSRSHLEQIMQRCRRLDSALDAVVRYLRVVPTSTPEPVDLDELTDRIVAGLEVPPAFEVVRGDLPAVHAPRRALEIVVEQLVRNALEHHDRDHGVVTVSGRRDGGDVVLCVEDDGPGIDPRVQARVFELFGTTVVDESAARGVGLALVRRLAEALGGRIELASDGRGASFTVTLPATAPPSP